MWPPEGPSGSLARKFAPSHPLKELQCTVAFSGKAFAFPSHVVADEAVKPYLRGDQIFAAKGSIALAKLLPSARSTARRYHAITGFEQQPGDTETECSLRPLSLLNDFDNSWRTEPPHDLDLLAVASSCSKPMHKSAHSQEISCGLRLRNVNQHESREPFVRFSPSLRDCLDLLVSATAFACLSQLAFV